MTGKLVTILICVLVGVVLFQGWMLYERKSDLPTTATTTTPALQATTTSTTPTDDPSRPLSDRVIVSLPKEFTTVGTSFQVKGEAPGPWFFEASFPISVRDPEGNVLARTHASAGKDWMTTEMVPFTATVHLDAPYSGPAILILMRDNPSGLPEYEDAIEVPITIQD